MHTLFIALAEYNKNVNAVVCGHLGSLSAEQYGTRFKAYYPSIAATLLHVMSSDAKWLGRFSPFRPDDFDSAALEEFKAACEKDPAFAFAGRERLRSLRRELDDRLIGLVAALEGIDLMKTATVSFAGGELTLELWKLLLQMFNHQTHHRGQVSVLLDLLGIENDYSRVIGKIG